MYEILLVEDDEALAIGVEYVLKKEGFKIKKVENLKTAKELISKEQLIDLILLDITLPDGNGYDFCKEIREKSDIPIIFLTACDDEVNIVLGLDLGGDDYITKPFGVKELISRIKAVLRRKGHNRNKIVINKDIILVQNLKLDLKQAKVYKNDTEELILTSLEYRLLLYFMQNQNQVLTRNQIFQQLWDNYGEFVDNNTLSVYIRRLREKIEDEPSEPKLIITIRGLGYKLEGDIYE